MSKLKPETLDAVAATYARILERKHPGSVWTVRPIEAGERHTTATLRHGRGKVATLNDDCTLVNGQPTSTDKHGIERRAQQITLVTDIKVGPRDASAIERQAA